MQIDRMCIQPLINQFVYVVFKKKKNIQPPIMFD